MRKIILTLEADPTTFEPTIILRQKHEDGNVTIIHSETVKPHPKYNEQELKKINTCNTILEDKGLEALTEEEIEFMLDPTGIGKRLNNLEEQITDTETLQRMAGFKVEKKIVPLD